MNTQIQQWLDYIQPRMAANTVTNYRFALQSFTQWLGTRPITPAVIEDYVTEQLKSFAPTTAALRLAALKSFGRWWSRRSGQANPAQGITIPAAQIKPTRQRVLTAEEYDAALAACERESDRDMVQLLAHTGLRVSEFLNLSYRHVSADGRFLTVTGKGNKTRTVPLNPTAQAVLATNRQPDDSLALLKTITHRNSVAARCRKLAQKANIPVFGPHALRHYFCTRLIQAGVPIKIVSTIMGHSSISVTEAVYCHLTAVDILGATDCLCC